MIDAKRLLGNDEVTALLTSRGVAVSEVQDAVAALRARNATGQALDEARALRKRTAKERRAAPDSESREELTRLQAAGRETAAVADERLRALPNVPDPRTPVTPTDPFATGGPPVGRSSRPHWEIAADLGLLDPDRAAALSGSGFAVFRGRGAALLRALVDYGLALHAADHEELVVPHLLLEQTLVGSGHLPRFADSVYGLGDDGLRATPTSESALSSFHANETLTGDPRRYMSYGSCFRREAGSWGKDAKGVRRLHEYHQIELVSICAPENADAELERLRAAAIAAPRELGLTYRVVELCRTELPFSAARAFRIDVHSPGTDTWIDVSCASDMTTFQSRRTNTGWRNAVGKREYAHTLTASGLAASRLWGLVIENGWRQDGSVQVPEPLTAALGPTL